MDAINRSIGGATGSSSKTTLQSTKKAKYEGRTLIKVDNVFSQQTLNLANDEINSMNSTNKITVKSNIKAVFFKNHVPPKPTLYIKFDNDSKMTDVNVLDDPLRDSGIGIKSLAKEGVEKMAKTLNWENKDVKVSFGLLRYELSASEPHVRDMPWHKDSCTITMTTLISPYEVNDNGFKGGELSVAPHRVGSTAIDPDTVTTNSYPYNGGFIFDNICSQHKVEDIESLDEKKLANRIVERRLFTVFASPSDYEVRNYPVTHKHILDFPDN